MTDLRMATMDCQRACLVPPLKAVDGRLKETCLPELPLPA